MAYRQYVAFINNIEISSDTRIVLLYMSWNSGLRYNLRRITVITTFNFPAEEVSVCIRKK